MLKQKSAFKPKATARRAAPGSGSQPAAQRPAPAESSSKTPAARESPPSSSQSQPAPHPVTSIPVDVGPPVSGDGAPRDAGAPSHEKQVETPAAEPEPQSTATPAVAVIAATAAEPKELSSAPTAVSSETPAAEPQTSVPQETTTPEGAPAAQQPSSGEAPVIRTDSPVQSVPEPRPTVAPSVDAAPAPPRTTAVSADSTPAPTTAPTPDAAQSAPAAPVEQTPPAQDQPVQDAATPAENAAGEQPQPATEAAVTPTSGPSEAEKPKQSRKRKTDAAAGEGSSEQSGTAAPPRKRTRIRAAPLPGEEGHQEGQTASRAPRTRRRSGSATTGGETEEDGEGNRTRTRRRTPRQQREVTPEDAENVEIDVTRVKMADLAKDMHIGKKFSLHDELMERERAKRMRYNERRKRQQSGMVGDDAAEEGEGPAGASSADQADKTQDGAAAGTGTGTGTGERRSAPIGEQYQIIDGEIVLDHRSLQVDRHARAREEAGQLVEVEENDFTHHTTSATYLRRNLKPQQWTDEETELFYEALGAFGTDFDTICRLFRGKTRKHVKLKFNREERVAPDRVNAALVGRKTVAMMSMDEYQRRTGRTYEPAEAIYAEQRRAEEEFEARQRALADERADEVRRKKEELLAQLNTSAGDEEGGGKKGGRKGRKKKAPNVVGL